MYGESCDDPEGAMVSSLDEDMLLPGFDPEQS